MPRHFLVLAGLFSAVIAGLPACSSPRQDVVIPLLETPVLIANIDPDFPEAGSILRGYDLAASADDWRVGDQLLIGIKLDKRGAVTTRMLRIELTDLHNPMPIVVFSATPDGRKPYRIESGVYYTRLTLYDAHASILKEGIGRFPDRIMGHGLFDGAAPSIDRPRRGTGEIDLSGVSEEQYEHELLGWLSLFSFSISLGKEGMFNSMVKDMVARPSLLTMLFNPDVSLGIGETYDVRRAAWAPAPGVLVDAVTMPLTCTISDKLAAVARVHAARPVAPLGLTAGVVSVSGHNADKPDIRFDVRILAAGRGEGGRAFLPATDDPRP